MADTTHSKDLIHTQEITEENVNEFLKNIDTFIFDCDGVLWRSKHLVPHADECLNKLRELGKHVFFVTNNSTKTRDEYVKVMENFGIDAKKDEIFGSAFAAASYLESISFKKKAYVVGSQGIVKELQDAGITVFDNESHNGFFSWEDLDNIEVDPEIGAVVTGLDLKMNYYKTTYAFNCLRRNKDCLFIATNLDSTYPGSHDRLFPGSGSTSAPLMVSTGKKPLVMGKPQTLMLDVLTQKFHINRERTCMVGDRLDTDITFGLSGGLKTLLVFTGVATRASLTDPHNTVHPHHTIESIGDLFHLHKKVGEKQ